MRAKLSADMLFPLARVDIVFMFKLHIKSISLILILFIFAVDFMRDATSDKLYKNTPSFCVNSKFKINFEKRLENQKIV